MIFLSLDIRKIVLNSSENGLLRGGDAQDRSAPVAIPEHDPTCRLWHDLFPRQQYWWVCTAFGAFWHVSFASFYKIAPQFEQVDDVYSTSMPQCEQRTFTISLMISLVCGAYPVCTFPPINCPVLARYAVLAYMENAMRQITNGIIPSQANRIKSRATAKTRSPAPAHSEMIPVNIVPLTLFFILSLPCK